MEKIVVYRWRYKLFNKIWEYKKKGEVHNDIGALCGKITDGIIKYSMQKKRLNNLKMQ